MVSGTGFRSACSRSFVVCGKVFGAARIGAVILAMAVSTRSAAPQPVDCGRLQAQIAALDASGGARQNRYAADIMRQRNELDRTIASARSLGCDRPQIPFFETPVPTRCPSLNAQIQQLQVNLGRLQAAAMSEQSTARADLVGRFNAYCRNSAQPPRPRNFFEQLFGGFDQRPEPPPLATPPDEIEADDSDAGGRARGGSQAVCVRSCDGGFFPLSVSARRADDGRLTELCEALCPNAPVSVYTKSPNQPIETAAALNDGAPYSAMPNALKFRTSYDAACTCKPPDQSWAEALAGAERLLGEAHKGDIIVTEEKANELSAPRPATKSAAKSSEKQAGAVKPKSRRDATPDLSAPERGIPAEPDSVTRPMQKAAPPP